MEIKPLTFLVGPNSSGKSSVFQAILALKQTVKSGDQQSPLILHDYVDLGSYKDIFFKHDTGKDLIIDFESLNLIKWSVTYSVQEDKKTSGKIVVKSFEFSNRNPADVFIDEKFPVPGNLRIVKEEKSHKYRIELDGQNSIPGKFFDLKKFYNISSKEILEPSTREMKLLPFLFPAIRTITEELFEHVYHIGPLRHEPERVYSASGAYPQSVGKYGQWSIEILQYDEELRNIINKWLKRFKIPIDFTLKELKKGSERYEVVLKDYFTKTEVNLADVGFGTSQILPIIVQGLTSPEYSTLLIEQPEIHLHPKAQCVMGDLLVDMIKTKNRRLIIETHSDLLIERVCKHILLKGEKTNIKPEDIIIYYFEQTKEGTEIRTITVNENAQFENFPEGFFEERFEEALARVELME